MYDLLFYLLYPAGICMYVYVFIYVHTYTHTVFTFSRNHGTRILHIYTQKDMKFTCLPSRRFVRAETQSAVEEREGRDPV